MHRRRAKLLLQQLYRLLGLLLSLLLSVNFASANTLPLSPAAPGTNNVSRAGAGIPTTLTQPLTGSLPLFDRAEFIEDTSALWQLANAQRQPHYQRLTQANYMRGFTQSAFWLRLQLNNPLDRPNELALYHLLAFTDRIDYWVLQNDRTLLYAIGGDRTLLAERLVPTRHPAILFSVPAHSSVTIYIRLHNTVAADTHLYFRLTSAQQFAGIITADQARMGALYGMPLALTFSALIGWLITRDRRFSLYALYVLAVLGSWLSLEGQLGQFVLIDMPDLVNLTFPMFFLLSITFSAMFSRDFLRTRELLPWADRFLQLMIVLTLAGCLVRALGWAPLIAPFVRVMLLAYAVTPLIGWLAYRKGVTYARWYVIAQGLYGLSVAAGIVGAYARWYSYDVFVFAEFAYFGELLLLSVAQYDRTRLLQAEKERAEQRYQTALENKNQELEQLVTERTRGLEEARQRAEFLSRTDELTGLGNRRHFLESAVNLPPGLAVLALIDLDHFKRINDTYGHPAGDAVLRDLGQVLRRHVRPQDIVARIGGEEFAILLQVPRAADATAILDRLRATFANEATVFDQHHIEHTLSLGYVVLPDPINSQRLSQALNHADEALYAAKHGGRNRLVAYAG